MANVISNQVLLDGPRNVIIKQTGILDTADVANSVLIDPAVLMPTDLVNGVKAATFNVMNVRFSIEDGLEVRLFWDATTPDLIEVLTGRGKLDFRHFGGARNPMSAGVTGKILYATQGWTASSVLSFTFEIELIKVEARTQFSTGATVNGGTLQQDAVDIAATIPRP